MTRRRQQTGRELARTPEAADTARTAAGVGERRVESVPGLDELAAALTTLRTVDEVVLFLRDLCTLPELEALAHRWQTARLLDEGMPYLEIADRVPTSTATVTRVAHWLRYGTGGYRIALARTGRRPVRRSGERGVARPSPSTPPSTGSESASARRAGR